MSIKSKYDVELDNKNYKEALKIINELLGKYLHIVFFFKYSFLIIKVMIILIDFIKIIIFI